MTEGGQCIESDSGGNYLPNYSCSWITEGAVTLFSHEFALGTGDSFLIGTNLFTGNTGPDNVPVASGQTLTFVSDADASQGTGFKICSFPFVP